MLIKVAQLSKLSNSTRARLVSRNRAQLTSVSKKVNQIITHVQKNGDRELLKYTALFDQVNLKQLAVSNSEIDWAYSQVKSDFLTALKLAAQNIRSFQQTLRPITSPPFSPQPGVSLCRRWTPITKIGIYVPGGKTSYPSTVLMTVIPAQVAGCQQIIVVTPPQANGFASPFITVACAELGIKQLYKVGGAQAIAALAFGTETIPPVYKIFGPGNAYVAAAKLAVSQTVAIDSPAGPSENFIIADESANPAFVAADLITDCEHGPDSAAILITTSRRLANQVVSQIKLQLRTLPTRNYVSQSFQTNGLIALADSLAQAVAFCNAYAPEHLQIMVRQPKSVLSRISNAGSIFVGSFTSKAGGDYATGANHTLPTSGFAKMYSSLSVLDFGKWTDIQSCTQLGLQAIAPTVHTLALAENLPAHINSVSVRTNVNSTN